MDRRHPVQLPVRARRARGQGRDRREGGGRRIQIPVRFRWFEEARPGPRWQQLFERTWPGYRRWFLGEGDGARPGLAECRRELAAHMPELVPMWEHLAGLAGGDDEAARMLSLVHPAPYLTGCSQAVWTHGSPMLVRNYDYRPDHFEGAVVLSRWHGTRVLATNDCLWGALDGINEHGLSVALAFGGSRAVGRGFGIPLILRYVLELCRTVEEAVTALRRIPCHMTYNVTLLDASGDYAVAHLSPRRGTEIVRERVCTNHQRTVEWIEYVEATRSEERHRFLKQRLRRLRSAERFVAAFLEPPLYASGHAEGYGTLYTVVYRPETGEAEFLWPQARVKQEIEGFSEMEIRVALDGGSGRRRGAGEPGS